MNTDIMLYRQVHPAHIQAGGISVDTFALGMPWSSVFEPNENDQGKLSLYSGEYFTPKTSFVHYTKNRSSAGVLGVTVAEFQLFDLPAATDNETFEGHVLVDYTDCTSNGEIKKKAKKIRGIAMQRNWQYTSKQHEQESESETDLDDDDVPF